MFRTGHLIIEHEHSGRPTQVTIPENVDAIHSIILDDRRISAKNIAETLSIHISKCLNADQKCDRVLASQAILDRFGRDPVGSLNPLVTMDETWIHTYDPETKEQSKE
jgi:hypothetical protein